MVKSFFLTLYRSFKKSPVYYFINLFGLSLGLGSCILLLLFIKHEISFDKFHENKNEIHRLISSFTTNDGKTDKTAITFGSFAPELVSKVPEVKETVRILRYGRWDVTHEESVFSAKNMLLVDDSFFDVFSFKNLIVKVSKTSFNSGGLVISSKFAQEIFNEIPKDTKHIEINNELLPIIGIIDVPKTSHLQFDILKSGESEADWDNMAYYSGLEFWTYIQYKKEADVSSTNDKIVSLYDNLMSKEFSDFTSSVHNEIQPLTKIHLYSEGISTSPNSGSLSRVRMMSLLTIIILGIAIINFINLSTALYQDKLKEIGIRKVLGAQRNTLIKRFLSESIFISILSLLLALLTVEKTIPELSKLLNINATTTYWQNTAELILIFIATLTIGALSGIHPALVVSRFSPMRLVKGNFNVSYSKNLGTKGLIVFQFVISTALLINLFYFNEQVTFLKNKPLGFSKDQVLVIQNLSKKLNDSYTQVSASLSSLPGIKHVTASQGIPGQGASGQTIYLEGQAKETALPISEIRTKHSFVETLDIKILSGRPFDPKLETDQNGFLLNKKAYEMLSPDGKDIINKNVIIADRKGPVLGIIEDFNYESSKYEIEPLALSLDDPYWLTLMIKLDENVNSGTIDQIENALIQIDGEYTMSHFFLDDFIQYQFRREEGYSKIISWSSALAAILSVIGILALAAFSFTKRIKEAAIRKVLGARLEQIGMSLSKDFMKILLIANMIAIPVAIMIANKWLQDFPIRISVESQWYWVVLIPFTITAITFSLLYFEVYTRTKENPASVLKDE